MGWLESHARHHATTAMLSHLNLHLHHILGHGFLDVRIFRSDVPHHRLLQFVVTDTTFDKELVIKLGLFDEHIDHHVHLAALAILHLLLHLSLLA